MFAVPDGRLRAADVVNDKGIEALQKGKTKYTPAAGLPELRRAICEKFERDNGLEYEPSQIIVSNGAKHSIFNVCYALVDEGDEVVIRSPSARNRV